MDQRIFRVICADSVIYLLLKFICQLYQRPRGLYI